MALLRTTIEVTDGPGGQTCGEYHIPGVHNMQATLCGFVDVSTRKHDSDTHPVNCLECISALKKIRALKFPKNYFAE